MICCLIIATAPLQVDFVHDEAAALDHHLTTARIGMVFVPRSIHPSNVEIELDIFPGENVKKVNAPKFRKIQNHSAVDMVPRKGSADVQVSVAAHESNGCKFVQTTLARIFSNVSSCAAARCRRLLRKDRRFKVTNDTPE